MPADSQGAHPHIPPEARLNIFALVIYVPNPLGKFLDDLRRELVPHYNPHAHVSVLPPRPLAVEWQRASEQVATLASGWAPFDVGLTQVAIFPVTNVIYIEVGVGTAELREMHGATNRECLEFEEPFVYHPHITLAQEVTQDRVKEVYDLAVRRWEEFGGPRQFQAERAVLVQNTLDNCWLDLAGYNFGESGIARE